MDPKRRPIWQATYKTTRLSGDGKRKIPTDYTVSGTSISECPVSYITPESYELVQMYARSKQIGGEQGTSSLFGPNLDDWPCRIADAFCALETEKVKTESARFEAEKGDQDGSD